jgi:hypothetical protein
MKPRDMMAPDTDPTDEELAIVAQEALRVVRERRAESDRRLAESLRQASIEVEVSGRGRGQDEGDGK